MTISRATRFKPARVAALLMGGTALLATPALAQRAPGATQPRPQQQQAAQPGQRTYNLSRPEQAAFAPLMAANTAANAAVQAGQTPDWAAVTALLPAARAAARSQDALYLVARVQLSVALGTNDIAGQERALVTLLASPATPPNEQAAFRAAQSQLVNQRAEQAFAANDFATAERLTRQLLQASPNDQRLQRNLRIIQERGGNTAGALQGLDQEIRAAEASGGRAPEEMYQRAWRLHHQARQRAPMMAALQRLLTNYPTPANWRNAVDVVRETSGEDTQLLLDIYRFARAANVLQPNEYVPLARTLDQAALGAEMKALLEAGIAARAINASDREVARLTAEAERRIAGERAGLPAEIQQARGAANERTTRNVADALYGYGRYAEAAELYRAALGKGGDASLLNLRIGVSLAQAGQRAEAETALRAVTGPRAELAALWLAWLARARG